MNDCLWNQAVLYWTDHLLNKTSVYLKKLFIENKSKNLLNFQIDQNSESIHHFPKKSVSTPKNTFFSKMLHESKQVPKTEPYVQLLDSLSTKQQVFNPESLQKLYNSKSMFPFCRKRHESRIVSFFYLRIDVTTNPSFSSSICSVLFINDSEQLGYAFECVSKLYNRVVSYPFLQLVALVCLAVIQLLIISVQQD